MAGPLLNLGETDRALYRMVSTASPVLHIAERMLVMRRFEEKVQALAEEKLIAGLYHLYIGQEAGGAAVIEALQTSDLTLSNHRNHGHIVGRGADLGRAFAELLGRSAGLNGGRGGTVHLCDPSVGFLLTSAILGGNLALALGAAYESKRRKQGRVAVVFFGDGSLEEGVAFEVFNIAAKEKLPILFVLENNNLEAISIHAGGFSAASTAVKDFCDIPRLFGISAQAIAPDCAVMTIHAQAQAALAHCRGGHGPFFLELMNVRWPGSNRVWPKLLTGVTDLRMAWGDAPISGEYAVWIERHDPVLRMARDYVGGGLASKKALLALDADVRDRIDVAVRFALDSPPPAPNTAFDHVFA
jgi:TPP-dependent pyruvate/acetoin dehydrogenase alpha subunit